MNILLLTAHDIAEYDDVRMFTDMGHDVFSIGAYTEPMKPASVMRPQLDVKTHPDLAQRCIEQREKHEGESDRVFVAGQVHNIVDWAKADLHPDIIDWADVIICHHYLESWIVRQWGRIKHKRVIWRTCGQSNALLEETMAPLRAEGLQIVRYSPKEEEAFTRLGVFAGQDALIRFGKYPSDYGPWIGDDPVVGNVTQNMAGRGEFCGLYFWLAATKGLSVKPAGLQSEPLPGGIGALSYPDMIDYLRHIRAYLYTGTQPASYTLGLIEALLTGVPVVSMGSGPWWIPDLFEGPEIARPANMGDADYHPNDPAWVRALLTELLSPDSDAVDHFRDQRQRAIEMFGIETIAPQWQAFLDGAVTEFSTARVSVTAA